MAALGQRPAVDGGSGARCRRTCMVDVMNQCLGDLGNGECAIAGIHVRSVRLVDPHKFRLLRHDDCLLNDERPRARPSPSSTPTRSSTTSPATTCVHPTVSP
ncbi:TPD1 precursor [Panicum miliaceum]|uniref:TPD1 n=1 Tax=Panicum miliaceum TaxID=4540 RepID=A0A3L6RT44_PANMI|nr:TPD1 precursor [Panicum miliaceum]